jgi:hypothetical protein
MLTNQHGLIVCKHPTFKNCYFKKSRKKYGVLSKVLAYGSSQQFLYVGEGSKCKPLSRILTLVPQPIGQGEGPKSLEGSTLKTFPIHKRSIFWSFHQVAWATTMSKEHFLGSPSPQGLKPWKNLKMFLSLHKKLS